MPKEPPDDQNQNVTGHVLESLLTSLFDKLGTSLSNLGLRETALREILAETQKGAVEATRQALRPENAEHPHISAFSYPEGDIARPKPTLTRETFFCGHRENEEVLTPAEIDAYNAITVPKECRGGAWRAEIRRSKSVGGKEELLVWVPAASVDQRMSLPHQLVLILHELNGGTDTSDVLSLISQIEALKQEVHAMKQGAMLPSHSGASRTAAELEQALVGS